MIRAALENGVLAAMDQAGRDVMQWGKDDCALWTSNIVRDALGYDPAAPWRGRYSTRNGSRRVLGPKGLLGAMRAAARRHKWKRTDPRMARPGDMGLAWVMVPVKGHNVPVLATVICRAPGWFVGRNEAGWTAITVENVAACWSVLGGRDNHPGPRMVGQRSGHWSIGPRLPVACHEPISATVLFVSSVLSVSTATASFIVATTISVAASAQASIHHPGV